MIAVLAVAWGGALRIEDLVGCTGDELPAGSRVSVHYQAWVQGELQPFDSSLKRGVPLEFTLGGGQMIEGWEIGMQGMSVGCKRRLLVPPELGYGDREIQGKIPAGSTLVFEIELLSAKSPRQVPAGPAAVAEYTVGESGVAWFDLERGTGQVPRSGQRVRVEYTLWLADGTLVDSSYMRAQPFEYRVGRGMVIEGWERGMAGMAVGGLRQFRVPWKLGYGRRGRPPQIPAKAELVFEVRLLSVE